MGDEFTFTEELTIPCELNMAHRRQKNIICLNLNLRKICRSIPNLTWTKNGSVQVNIDPIDEYLHSQFYDCMQINFKDKDSVQLGIPPKTESSVTFCKWVMLKGHCKGCIQLGKSSSHCASDAKLS